MTTVIKRHTVAGVLDAAFRIYRHQFGSFFLLAVIESIPFAMMTVAIDGLGDLPDPTVVPPSTVNVVLFIGFMFMLMAAAMVTKVLVQATSVLLVHDEALGRAPDLKRSFVMARSRFWKTFLAVFLAHFASGGGLVFCVFPGIALFLLFMLVVPVVTIENRNPLNALQRSFDLAKGRWHLLIGVPLFLVLFFSVPAWVPVLMEGVLGTGSDLPSVVARTMASSLSQGLVFPLVFIFPTIIYYDARVELEAYDVQALASSAVAPAKPIDDSFSITR